MKLIHLLWATRERPARRGLTNAEVVARLYGRRAFWRTGLRTGWRG